MARTEGSTVVPQGNRARLGLDSVNRRAPDMRVPSYTVFPDDWVVINEIDDESDSGWTTPSCTSSQPGSPHSGAAPAPALTPPGTNTALTPPGANPALPPPGANAAPSAVVPPAFEAKKASSGARDEGAVAPESPPQVRAAEGEGDVLSSRSLNAGQCWHQQDHVIT